MEWEKARGKGTPPQCVVRILSPFAQRDPAVAKARKTGAEGCPLTGSWVPWSSKVINRQARSFWSPRGIGAHLGIAKATRIKVLQLLEWCLSRIVLAVDVTALPPFALQLHRGLKDIHVQAQRSVQFRQLAEGRLSREAIIAHQPFARSPRSFARWNIDRCFCGYVRG
jgi:hypothetical protein